MSKRKKHKGKMEGASGGIILIGIGVLFLVDEIDFWPWILVVIGLAGFPASLATEGLWAGLQTLVWMVGLAILFHAGIIWPGILILVGLSIMAGALSRPPIFKEKAKPSDTGYEE